MHDPQQIPPIFRIDVSADSSTPDATSDAVGSNLIGVLRQMLEKQQRANELLEDIGHQLVSAQKQRAAELVHCRGSNPDFARNC
ncbi:MAG: hypothetical protein ABGX07_13815, partial [Pirellulaceae bacterium]